MLMVLVKEAKNLVPVARGAANADPFCKWYVLNMVLHSDLKGLVD